MKWRVVSCALIACMSGMVGTLGAQEKARLTVEEAIDLAMRNNPNFLQTLNDLGPANWGVRSATANLLLPSANLSFLTAWQGQGQQRFATVTFPQPAVLLSQWRLSLSYNLNGTTLFSRGQRKAERRAAERRIDDAELVLRNQVTSAYLEVLRLEARAEQAGRELRRAEEHLRLAEAREQVGAGTRLETMQADVARGRAEVDLLQAENAARVSKLRLIQALGIQVAADRIELVSDFDIFEPKQDLEDLIADAMARHPSLVALRADRAAAHSSVKVAKSSYFPSLSLQASLSGFAREETNPDITIGQRVSQARSQALANTTSCNQLADLFNAALPPPPPPLDNCSAFAFTTQDSIDLDRQFRKANDNFPFSFQSEPVTLSASLSFPIFNGFQRQLELEQAIARQNDLKHQVRGLELQIRADVTEAVHNLDTAYRTVRLQEENTQRAREELRLARERYQLGAGTFLELLDSETLAAQAEVDQIEAVFAFHQALTALEAAVGHSIYTSSGE